MNLGIPTLIKSVLLTIPCILSYSVLATNATPTIKQQVVAELKTLISEHYVEKDQLPKINSVLMQQVNSADFKQTTNKAQIANLLKASLLTIDPHFSVGFISKEPKAPKKSWLQRLKDDNYGFTQSKILEGNIGYVSFWGFAEPNRQAKRVVDNIFKQLQGVDALIFDLTDNEGGRPDMVQYISSYFYNEPTLLNTIHYPKHKTVREFWTKQAPTTSFVDTPLYILVSNTTFSAAEEFTYNLKHLKRATIIGEQTRGGANPWERFHLTEDGFYVAIPTAKSVNPITKSNWNGTGVTPHHLTTKAQALDFAIGLINTSQ